MWQQKNWNLGGGVKAKKNEIWGGGGGGVAPLAGPPGFSAYVVHLSPVSSWPVNNHWNQDISLFLGTFSRSLNVCVGDTVTPNLSIIDEDTVSQTPAWVFHYNYTMREKPHSHALTPSSLLERQAC